VPVLLTRILVLLLAVRAIAAPVALRPSFGAASEHRFFVIHMRCWPPQQLQRFSSSSKLLQLCTGKNKVTSAGGCSLLTLWPQRPASKTPLSLLVPEVPGDTPTNRLTVCLRC
jgi:hypothetical protein